MMKEARFECSWRNVAKYFQVNCSEKTNVKMAIGNTRKCLLRSLRLQCIQAVKFPLKKIILLSQFLKCLLVAIRLITP